MNVIILAISQPKKEVTKRCLIIPQVQIRLKYLNDTERCVECTLSTTVGIFKDRFFPEERTAEKVSLFSIDYTKYTNCWSNDMISKTVRVMLLYRICKVLLNVILSCFSGNPTDLVWKAVE